SLVKNPQTKEVTPTVTKPSYVIPLKPENLDVIRRAMVDVMRKGTARRAFAGAGYQAAGKTGTAQVYSLKGAKYNSGAIDERLRDHALFMAYAPMEDPQIAVALIIENGGWGATVAAPVARTVFDYWLSPERLANNRRLDLIVAATEEASASEVLEEGATGESMDALVRPEDLPEQQEEAAPESPLGMQLRNPRRSAFCVGYSRRSRHSIGRCWR